MEGVRRWEGNKDKRRTARRERERVVKGTEVRMHVV